MSNPAVAPVRTVRAEGEQFAHSRELEWLARAGLVARGVIYAIIAVLAIKLALGDGGKATNQQGALRTIAHQPFGKALLVVVAIGLAGYAIWRLVRAAIGHGPESRDSGKERLAGLASGVAYGLLCGAAVKILLASGTSSSGGPQKAAGGVLDWTGGTWLVGLGGVVLLVVAAEQAYKGVTKEFLEKSKTAEMSREVRRAFTALGVFGHVARAVVFALIGYGLIRAAIDYDPHKAIGLDGALAKLGQASYGPVLLGVVAVGLLGFGAYSIADARYRKV
jgi:hypothetical protein